MNYTILQGDNRTTLKTLADNSIDAIVTDPPYGIDFLGKSWDANTGALETYQECLRVLKPGGHILAFSAARTYHHLAVTLEQAGFEIRDQIMWIYSSGFPKSQDIGKQIEKKAGNLQKSTAYDQTEPLTPTKFMKNIACKVCGTKSKNPKGVGYYCGHSQAVEHQTEEGKTWSGWGTALKPAHEPIALARKPMKGSIRENCLKWGVGALNIDATRVPYESEDDYDTYINNLKGPMERSTAEDGDGLGMFEGQTGFKAQKGKVVKSANPNIATNNRPPNGASNGWSRVGFSEQPVEKYKDQKKSTKPKIGTMGKAPPNLNAIGTPSTIETSDEPWIPSDFGRFPSNVVGEIPDYQKYFYCPKVSRKERHIGFDLETIPSCGTTHMYDPVDQAVTRENKPKGGNNHPTVKPIELMKYLIKLITPPGGTVLDPFNGSGSTGCAAVELGHTYIGCELDPNYVAIASKRIEAWYEATRDPAKELFD